MCSEKWWFFLPYSMRQHKLHKTYASIWCFQRHGPVNESVLIWPDGSSRSTHDKLPDSSSLSTYVLFLIHLIKPGSNYSRSSKASIRRVEVANRLFGRVRGDLCCVWTKKRGTSARLTSDANYARGAVLQRQQLLNCWCTTQTIAVFSFICRSRTKPVTGNWTLALLFNGLVIGRMTRLIWSIMIEIHPRSITGGLKAIKYQKNSTAEDTLTFHGFIEDYGWYRDPAVCTGWLWG